MPLAVYDVTRRSAFTCVGWQVILCDPIWQVMSHRCEMGVPVTAVYAPLSFTFCMGPLPIVPTVRRKQKSKQNANDCEYVDF